MQLFTRAEAENGSSESSSAGETEAVGPAALLAQDPSAVPDAAKAAVGTVLEDVREAESVDADSSNISSELAAIYATCRWWMWRGFKINYAVQGTGPSILLVHGFGASVGHWRRNIGVLAQNNKVYAIDLLGLGASDKPSNFTYTMETWAQMLSDFLREVIAVPTVLIGNSIGSLACVIVASEAPKELVRGIVLLNCAGGMNNKAVVDDWRIRLFLPLLWLIEFILKQRFFGSRLFQRLQTRDNLRNVLQSVYCNKDAVDDELIEVIGRPAKDSGALDAFVSVVTGPPGPSPMSLLPEIAIPVLVLWGDKDPFTPIDGPVGKFFRRISATQSNVDLVVLFDVGHCPHDDRPELVHNELVPWLANLKV